VLAAPFVEWIAGLHEQAAVSDAAQFRSAALRSLLEVFDGSEAFWTTGAAGDDRSRTVAHAIRGGAPHIVALGRDDADPSASWREPTASGPDRIVWRVREPLSGLTTGIAIRRRRGRAPFDARDLDALRLVAPHLLLAWRSCQTLKLYRRAATAAMSCGLAASACGGPTAIVDRDGYLQVADHQFLGALRRCWPDWTGLRVPAPLRVLLAGAACVTAADLQWSIVEEGELLFLSASPIGVLARLTAREREAALALLAGRPYADCARQLGISANTLRNTIARVYRKLGVAGKLELAQRVGFVVPAAR
jgi:DNA-binding CsgD family transcriptional regulator